MSNRSKRKVIEKHLNKLMDGCEEVADALYSYNVAIHDLLDAVRAVASGISRKGVQPEDEEAVIEWCDAITDLMNAIADALNTNAAITHMMAKHHIAAFCEMEEKEYNEEENDGKWN